LTFVREVERSADGQRLFDTEFHGRITGTDCMRSLGPVRYRNAQVFLCHVNLRSGISETWCVTIAEGVLFTDRNSTLPCVRIGRVPELNDVEEPPRLRRVNTALWRYLMRSPRVRSDGALYGPIFVECESYPARYRGQQVYRCEVDATLTGVWCVAVVHGVLKTIDRHPQMSCYEFPQPAKVET
jgi:hypothetical protein